MEISKDYPQTLSTEDLIKEMRKYILSATQASSDPQYTLGPAYWREISILGQNELSLRVQKELNLEIKNLKSEIAQLKSNNRKSSIWNGILSGLTIVIAGITLFIGYNTLDSSEAIRKSDLSWKNEIILLMKNANSLIQENTSKMDSLIDIKSSTQKK